METRIHYRLTALLRCLVLLGVMARAMVPAGFMPAFASTGDELFPMVICSGVTGNTTVYLPADQLPDQPEKKQHAPAAHDAPCAFAVHFSLGTTANPPQLPNIFTDKTLPAPPANVARDGQRDPKSYLSQGPPVTLKFR